MDQLRKIWNIYMYMYVNSQFIHASTATLWSHYRPTYLSNTICLRAAEYTNIYANELHNFFS